MQKFTLALIPGLFLWSLTGAGAVAFARDYEVELIVFERISAESQSGEDWNFSRERIAARLQKIQDLESQAIEFETSPELNNLAQVRDNLSNEGYRILHSAHWIQPAEIYQNAPLIGFGTEDTQLPFGFIRVYKTSLIFADIDLQLSPVSLQTLPEPYNNINSEVEMNSPDTLVEFQQPHFFISEKRRLKFKEIHYFDHPRFGAIMGVWPVDEEL